MDKKENLKENEDTDLILKILKTLKIRVKPNRDLIILTAFFRWRFFKLKIAVNEEILEKEGIIDHLESMLEYIVVHHGVPIVKGKWYDFWYIKGFKKGGENDEKSKS